MTEKLLTGTYSIKTSKQNRNHLSEKVLVELIDGDFGGQVTCTYYGPLIERPRLRGCYTVMIRLARALIHCLHMWLSGRELDSRPRGRWFEPHQCHCVVVLKQDTFILAYIVLVQPRKTRPCLTERLLMGCN